MVKFSNYTYEPSLGTRRGAGKPDIDDAPVVPLLQAKLIEMARDIETLQSECPLPGEAAVHLGSWSTARGLLAGAVGRPRNHVSALREQLSLPAQHPAAALVAGFRNLNRALREIEQSNFGKFWQTVREQPEIALSFNFPALKTLLDEIRQTKHQHRVYDGQGWANYLATYFNDSFDFLKALSDYLAPGGRALVVIGNSVVQGHEVRTDEVWADIAASNAVGLSVQSIDVVRKKRVGNSIINSSVRNSAARGVKLYEAILTLEKPKASQRCTIRSVSGCDCGALHVKEPNDPLIVRHEPRR